MAQRATRIAYLGIALCVVALFFALAGVRAWDHEQEIRILHTEEDGSISNCRQDVVGGQVYLNDCYAVLHVEG